MKKSLFLLCAIVALVFSSCGSNRETLWSSVEEHLYEAGWGHNSHERASSTVTENDFTYQIERYGEKVVIFVTGEDTAEECKEMIEDFQDRAQERKDDGEGDLSITGMAVIEGAILEEYKEAWANQSSSYAIDCKANIESATAAVEITVNPI
jgi:hypothetical protein